MFILRSFTKIFGLTGLRVGYGIANEEIINFLSCAKIPWNVNCLAQAAAVAALKDEDIYRLHLSLSRKRKRGCMGELGKFGGFKFTTPDANFFFIDIRKSGLTAAEIKEQDAKAGYFDSRLHLI